jgi:hypothetical protein
MTVGSFKRLAQGPDTLRFSFVRNPYARAVSCWADKYAAKPLVRSDFFINKYLAARQELSLSLPAGPDQSLSFADFVNFVARASDPHKDNHLHAQSSILALRGLKLDFIGKVESYCSDFRRVLEHVDACDEIVRDSAAAVNASHHDAWDRYYTKELSELIYRTYEADFDQFKYPRSHH